MRIVISLVVVAGCGRVAFDVCGDAAVASDASEAFAECYTDNLSSLVGWQTLTGGWNLQPGAGPDGSTALAATTTTNNFITHPQLADVRAGHVSIDFLLSAPNGDFNIWFMRKPADWQNEYGYEGGVFPIGGDTPVDSIDRYDAAVETKLVTGPHSITANVWQRVDFIRRGDGSMVLALGGTTTLESPPDTTYQPPYDIVFRMFGQGLIDNLHVDCARR